MKKKLLSALLITSMVVTVFAGCGTNSEKTDDTESVESTESVSEEENEESITEYNYSVQTHGIDNAMLRITSTDDAGNTNVEETNSYGWFGSAGGTLGETMEEWNIESIEIVCDEFDFLGWSAYTIEYADPEDPGAFDEEVPLYDGKIFTTEEIMAMELPECDVYFYTEWDMTCSGCQQQKVCDVYYIDDDRYIVCDDCYVEFATGMGLLSDGEYLGNTTYECSGCEIEKDCGIYWVGDREYYVCDDCYEEFATGMGLN